MHYENIAKEIIALKDADLNLRTELIKNGQLGKGYTTEMEKIHFHNANSLNKIIDVIGYPTVDKVGKEASEASWLIIQHAIGHPDFMRKCLKLLENAVELNQASPINLAYLSDRINVLEDKEQCYGTQFDWDEHGELSPNRIDSIVNVNKRRKLIGLNTLEEQTEIMRNQVNNEKQSPPDDFKARKREIYEWRKTVGWVK